MSLIWTFFMYFYRNECAVTHIPQTDVDIRQTFKWIPLPDTFLNRSCCCRFSSTFQLLSLLLLSLLFVIYKHYHYLRIMFFVSSPAWDKESNLRPPMLYHWPTETLWWARSITKFIHDTRLAYCQDQRGRWRHVCK